MPDALPDDARVWLLLLDGAPDALAAVEARVAAWLPSWQSHGRPVRAEARLAEPGVLVVSAVIDPRDLNAGVSGCGIDAMQHAVEAAAAAAGVALVPALSVRYRDEAGRWQTAGRPAFRRLARAGAVGPATPVADVSAQTLGALRAGGVVRPAGEAWTGRTFGLAA